MLHCYLLLSFFFLRSYFLSRWIIYWRWQSPLNFKLLVHFGAGGREICQSMKKMSIAHCKPIERESSHTEWVGERFWLGYPPRKNGSLYRWIIRSNLYMDFKFISFYLNYFLFAQIDSSKRTNKKSLRSTPKYFFYFIETFAFSQDYNLNSILTAVRISAIESP